MGNRLGRCERNKGTTFASGSRIEAVNDSGKPVPLVDLLNRKKVESHLYTQIDPVEKRNGENCGRPRWNALETVSVDIANDPSQAYALKSGDIVRCLDFETLKHYNHLQQESFLRQIANQRCIIVQANIPDRKLTLLHFYNSFGNSYGKRIGNVSLFSCKIEKEAREKRISDGKFVRISSLVKSKGSSGELRSFNEIIGKTGIVTHIFETGKIRVQYAFGVKMDYHPETLVSSFQRDIETMDSVGNWIGVNSPVRVTNDEKTIMDYQNDVTLPCDSTYLKMKGKVCRVISIKLVPYVYDRDIVVISENKFYTLNSKLITGVTHTKESTGQEIGTGDIVILGNDTQVRRLQTPEFGCWNQSILDLCGKVGIIKGFDVSSKFPVTNLRVKVQFFDDGSKIFVMNPKTLIKITPGQTEEERDESLGKSTSLGLPDSFEEPSETAQPSPTVPVPENLNPCMYMHTYPHMMSEVLECAVKGNINLINEGDVLVFNKLGEGKFGEVFSGNWLGKDCAIKKIKPEFYAEIDSHGEILREAQIQLSLKHPNIVQLFGIVHNSEIWMILELVQGVDLHRRLWEMPMKFRQSSLWTIAKQLGRAVAYLHDNGILHGDIKTSNVMIDTISSKALLCDFGTSKFLGKEGKSSTPFTSTLSGTLCYLAPECVKIHKDFDMYVRPTFKSDVWSLGAMFLEMFTSRNLEEFHNSITAYQSDGDRKHLKDHYNNLPSEIKNVIAVSLRVDPEKRPSAARISNVLLNKQI